MAHVGEASANSVYMGGGTTTAPQFTSSGTAYFTGISFDSGSDTLSSYVQGTFTPTVSNSGSAPTGVTYTTQTGTYTRIGNRVVCNFFVTMSGYTAGTGNWQGASLPYTSNSTANNSNEGSMQFQYVTFGTSVSYYVANMAPNTAVFTAVGVISAAATLTLVASGFASNSIANTTLVYNV
jgi:hypothetical protein